MQKISRANWLLIAVLAGGCSRAGPAPEPPAPVVEVRPAAAAVLGVLLPQTGAPSLAQYGRLVMEGVQLALDEHRSQGGRAVELAVLDDGGDATRDASLLRQLEERGAAAIIGPLLSDGVQRAASARQDSSLVLLSPTASDEPGARNAFSLNSMDTQGASALARYATGAGLRRVAMLHPSSGEHARSAREFADAARAAGAQVVADVPFDSGTTNFGSHVRTLLAANPQAVYIAAGERDLRQLAPQLEYYGLTRRQIQLLGSEAWTSDEILRLVDPKYTDDVIASTPLNRASAAAGWRDFVALYERTHRRTLDNPYPALGYDAARLVLSALNDARTPADVARRVAGTREVRGATGILSVQDGRIVRRPFLVRIQNRQLVDVR